MKPILNLLVMCVFIVSCNETKNDYETKKSLDKYNTKSSTMGLEGNWEMVGFYNYKDNKITDSFKTNDGYRQVKMFNKDKVMWSKLVPTDSIEWFGYGSYIANDSTLTEILEYGSSIMNNVIADRKEFKYKLILKGDMFSQVELDEDGNMMYSENYKRID